MGVALENCVLNVGALAHMYVLFCLTHAYAGPQLPILSPLRNQTEEAKLN